MNLVVLFVGGAVALTLLAGGVALLLLTFGGSHG